MSDVVTHGEGIVSAAVDRVLLEGDLRTRLSRLADEKRDPHEWVGLIYMDAGKVDIVPRTQITYEDLPHVVEYSMPLVFIENGRRVYDRMLFRLPEPWKLTCEQCDQPARVILTQRPAKPDAPIHPRCQDHLSPGSAKAIDERGDV